LQTAPRLPVVTVGSLRLIASRLREACTRRCHLNAYRLKLLEPMFQASTFVQTSESICRQRAKSFMLTMSLRRR